VFVNIVHEQRSGTLLANIVQSILFANIVRLGLDAPLIGRINVSKKIFTITYSLFCVKPCY
jgi:hypothetical protein